MSFLLSALVGCCVAVYAQPKGLASTQELSGKEGVVVFKLITNGWSALDPVDVLDSVTLRRELAPGEKLTRMDDVILWRTYVATSTTAVFSGIVLPGRYTLFQATGGRYTLPMEKMLSPFEVRINEVSLLGTLMLQPLGDKKYTVVYVPPDQEMRETFADLFPVLASQTQGSEVHSLEPTSALALHSSMAPVFKQFTYSMNRLTQTSDGAFFAGSKHGIALWRKPGDTRWRALDVGSWREVLSLRPYRNALVAAGEEGLLRMSQDEGKTWSSLMPPDRGAIYAVEPLPNGKAFAVSRHGMRWSTYVSDDLMSGRWKKLSGFDDDGNAKDRSPGYRPIVVMDNRVGVVMSRGAAYVTDSETGELTRVPTRSLAAYREDWPKFRSLDLGASVSVSLDQGANWATMLVGDFTTAVAFKNPQTIYAVAKIFSGVPGSQQYGLLKSADGGKTWIQTGESPGQSGQSPMNLGIDPAMQRNIPIDWWITQSLQVDRFDDSLLAFMRDGSAMRSRDEGKTWIQEH